MVVKPDAKGRAGTPYGFTAHCVSGVEDRGATSATGTPTMLPDTSSGESLDGQRRSEMGPMGKHHAKAPASQ